ncbi:poly(A)-binding protein binding protein [Ceratocystis pirilliformis]|uniref:Poly(A)-binding protein binding protein n=1 Tax=Ceratocystis pirilliformis TaxID=259994 RepID=A0ABR3ZDH0_9PEZI
MMPAPKKDSDFSRPRGVPNGNNRMSFRTDTAISNNRGLHERTLQRWKPEGDGSLEGSLESTSNNANNNGRSWDQFAVNEKLFGLKTDYDENMYTTSIDRSHPQYKERLASADIKAREIERSAPVTNHQAEERIMDFIGADKGGDEEDKYSGVRRTQDFVPLNSSTATSTAKYTPPAKRAPSAQATVSGAPFDPAIISSQLRVANGSGSKRPTKGDDGRTNSTTSSRASHTPAKVDTPKIDAPKPNDSKAQLQPQPAIPRLVDSKTSSPKPTDTSRPEAPSTPAAPKSTAMAKPAPTPSTARAAVKPANSATVNVERAVLSHFKQFASKERSNAEKVRSTKLRQDKEDRLLELRKFATTFKLTTPIPNDLIGIIAKDPAKQQQIAKKAKQNAHDANTKPSAENDDAKNPTKDSTAISGTKDAVTSQPQATTMATAAASGSSSGAGLGTTASVEVYNAAQNGDQKSVSSKPQGPAATNQSGSLSRYGSNGSRNFQTQPQQQQQQYHNNYRGDRSAHQHIVPSARPSSQIHRPRDQPKAAQPHHTTSVPPTGPCDSSFNRRMSGNGVSTLKMNVFAPAFNPTGVASVKTTPATTASPKPAPTAIPDAVPSSTASHVTGPMPVPVSAPTPTLVRRKTKAVDPKKCDVLAHIKSVQAPRGRSWDFNLGLVPAFDTVPTWRQLKDDEKEDSTMKMTIKTRFEKMPFVPVGVTTPIPSHLIPQGPHSQGHMHIPSGPPGIVPRQSPHIPSMQMQSHQGLPNHVVYAGDDRMMHSQSQQSFASPRLSNMQPFQVNSPAQMAYTQPVVPPYGPPGPQMNQYRPFPNNQFMPQQGHMSGPMGPPFIGGPHAPGMYPGHPPYISQGPPPVSAANGFSSPGRPSAPMMAHQGSQQGQPGYGMSPGMQYNSPVFVPGQQGGGQLSNVRNGFNGPGGQHYGSSPQQMHQFGPGGHHMTHRSTSHNGYKNYQSHNNHHNSQQQHMQQQGQMPSHGQSQGSSGQQQAPTPPTRTENATPNTEEAK